MAISTVKKITSWSYSRYGVYKECPAKAKYKFIDKLPEPPAPAMARGNQIHKLAENYTKGLIKKLPQELKLFGDQFAELKKSKARVEETWAFTKEWHETTWNDWNGCWVRIKTDASLVDETTLYVIDHKTGKMRDGYEEQLSLYALGGMLKHPYITTVSTQLWYLDNEERNGDPLKKDYSIREFATLKASWDKKVQPMMNDTRFAPKPGNHCRWCAFSKAKGGPCKF